MLKVKLPDGSSSTWEVDFIINGMYAIEFNGAYWHSDTVIIANHNTTALSSHTMKHDAIINAGMVPLFTWEDDWMNHHDMMVESLHAVIDDGNLFSCIAHTVVIIVFMVSLLSVFRIL